VTERENVNRPISRDERGETGEDGRVAVRISALEKRFRRASGEWTNAVDGLSLDIHVGEMVVVLGASGCGKTTTLRCVAGLEAPNAGEITADGVVLSSAKVGVVVPPERRGFGMMFQSYAVWPHMSVFANVAYPLKARHMPRADIKQRVDDVLALVGISHLRDEYSSQLSGGQQQRVALARCLVASPRVILFDEPLSNVDARVREDLRAEILAMKDKTGFGGLYVTHDQHEAMEIADRIAVMDKGRIIQIGTPREIYGSPSSLAVARFVGTLSSWQGTVESVSGADGLAVISSAVGLVAVAPDAIPLGASPGTLVWLACRPEDVRLAQAGEQANVWDAVVTTEAFRGSHSDCTVEVGEVAIRIQLPAVHELRQGRAVRICVPPPLMHVFSAESRPAEIDVPR
jgi:iron(III) transport system ATP-binding protein